MIFVSSSITVDQATDLKIFRYLGLNKVDATEYGN